jgi:6-phosphogluconolactonase/glucosamine-6-phosphate isomerase/deaminase
VIEIAGRNGLSAPRPNLITRRVVGNNIWLGRSWPAPNRGAEPEDVASYQYEVLASEEAVGQAQLDELKRAAAAKSGDLVVILLGGRGAQALYRILGAAAQTAELDDLLGRLRLFTQDALAPLRMESGLSFVRDFERLLGPAFFAKVKSFTPMRTDTPELEAGLAGYLEQLESTGGADICFLGLGPEADAASHLAYIKPGSGAIESDLGGMIPISASILEHHISKFKVGGSTVTAEDEAECRAATHILTLGPAAILNSKRVVQSIVDAGTAPAKRASFRRVIEMKISADPAERAAQMDENPGLWLRIHPNVRSLILPDVLEA